MAQVVSEDFTVARDGLTLQGHVEYPQGSTHDRVVICMHGFLRDMGVKPGELYQDISDALTAHGMTCVRFDFNGRGRSEGAFEDSDVFNQIEDAIAVLNHVRDACDPLEISLLGHSQGGVVAGMTAGMFSDVIHTLVMLAPAASLKDAALRGELLGTPFDVNRVPRRITLAGGQTIAGKSVRIAQMLPIYETTAMFHGPALVIQGKDDAVIGPHVAANYGAAMPNCEASLYTDLGHAFTGEDRVTALTEATQFLVNEEEAV